MASKVIRFNGSAANSKIATFSATIGVSGLGALATGLTAIAGPNTAAVVNCQNSANTVTTDIATIHSIVGGTVNVVVVGLAAAANAIETSGTAIVGGLAVGV